jgi:hypothetical protein
MTWIYDALSRPGENRLFIWAYKVAFVGLLLGNGQDPFTGRTPVRSAAFPTATRVRLSIAV